VRFALSRTSTSSTVDLMRGPKPCWSNFSAVASGVDLDQAGFVGGVGLDQALARAAASRV
jgi:hypothetical protein